METTKSMEGHEMADPCVKQKDLDRIEGKVTTLEGKVEGLLTEGAGTRVYMKMVLDSQEEIKNSIKDIQQDLKDRPSPKTDSKQPEWVQMLVSGLFDVIKWSLALTAASLGIKNFIN